jgi:hypothetical protein
VRDWFPTAEVVALTRAVREQQRREEQEKASREAWELAQRRVSAELRTPPDQARQEAEIADLRRQVAELKKAQGVA